MVLDVYWIAYSDTSNHSMSTHPMGHNRSKRGCCSKGMPTRFHAPLTFIIDGTYVPVMYHDPVVAFGLDGDSGSSYKLGRWTVNFQVALDAEMQAFGQTMVNQEELTISEQFGDLILNASFMQGMLGWVTWAIWTTDFHFSFWRLIKSQRTESWVIVKEITMNNSTAWESRSNNTSVYWNSSFPSSDVDIVDHWRSFHPFSVWAVCSSTDSCWESALLKGRGETRIYLKDVNNVILRMCLTRGMLIDWLNFEDVEDQVE